MNNFSAQKFLLVAFISVIKYAMKSVHRAQKKVPKNVYVAIKCKNETVTALFGHVKKHVINHLIAEDIAAKLNVTVAIVASVRTDC